MVRVFPRPMSSAVYGKKNKGNLLTFIREKNNLARVSNSDTHQNVWNVFGSSDKLFQTA